ncbi:MAG: anti-sigma factor antagonist [Lachnospiraceae bacterium]|nr:anti-sigma factor antagonist [Lachnospiraceae bacterium]
MGQQEGNKAAQYEQIGSVLIIMPTKELDHCTAVDVRQEADEQIERGGALHLLFDFSKIRFMDSSGIGVIMGRYKKVIFQGGNIACCGVEPEIDRILTLSGLYRIMPRFESRGEALAALGKNKPQGIKA